MRNTIKQWKLTNPHYAQYEWISQKTIEWVKPSPAEYILCELICTKFRTGKAHSKRNDRQNEKTTMEWEKKILANHISDKRLILKIYKYSCNSIVKDQITQFKNGQKRGTWVARLSVWLLISAQVISHSSCDRAPRWARPWGRGAFFGFSLSLSLSAPPLLSLSK